MSRWIATLLIVALVGWVGVVSAQTTAPATPPAGQAPAAAPPAAGEKTMEGKVKSADQAKKEITLEDGTKVMIPTAVQVSWAELKPGKTVLISYSGTAQRMTVKKVEVK
jgi:Protein of unknown function (DUF1344)